MSGVRSSHRPEPLGILYIKKADAVHYCIGFSITAREPVRMLAGAQATTRYAGV